MEVYDQFLGPSRPIWKNKQILIFSIFFCHNLAKNGWKCPKSKSPNPPIKNLFSLQISAHLVFKWLRKSKMITFLGVPITFVISTCKKVDFLDFLGHLKAKWAENWCQDRFLKIIMGDFYFKYFLTIFGWVTEWKKIKRAKFTFFLNGPRDT